MSGMGRKPVEYKPCPKCGAELLAKDADAIAAGAQTCPETKR